MFGDVFQLRVVDDGPVTTGTDGLHKVVDSTRLSRPRTARDDRVFAFRVEGIGNASEASRKVIGPVLLHGLFAVERVDLSDQLTSPNDLLSFDLAGT